MTASEIIEAMEFGATLYRGFGDVITLTATSGTQQPVRKALFDALVIERRIRNQSGVGLIGKFVLVER